MAKRLIFRPSKVNKAYILRCYLRAKKHGHPRIVVAAYLYPISTTLLGHHKDYNKYFLIKMQAYYHYLSSHSPRQSPKLEALANRYEKRKFGGHTSKYAKWKEQFTSIDVY